VNVIKKPRLQPRKRRGKVLAYQVDKAKGGKKIPMKNGAVTAKGKSGKSNRTRRSHFMESGGKKRENGRLK